MADSALQRIQHYFQAQKFEVTPNKQFADVQLNTNLYALRNGKTMGILPYGDYYFVHDFDQRTNTHAHLLDIHEKARKYVNSMYRVPKILRLSVPNIITLAVSNRGFTPEMTEEVQKRTRSIVGGEIHAMYLLDLQSKQVFSQGISLTYVVGEARLIWGSQKEFKKIDPQNRAYYFVQALAETLFKQMR